MELGVEVSTEISKKIFRLKPMKSNGLLLRIYHKLFNTRSRFIYSCFHPSNNQFAVANNHGNIFIIDYSSNKFWGLPEIHSTTFIEFSLLNENHLLTGINTGDILICNVQSGHICGVLIGHKFSVYNVSFAKQKFLLSASKYEALVWDLTSTTKLQVLNLQEDCSLKYVGFIPVSGNVLACFQDDLIQIWSHKEFENIKTFSPSNWKHYSVKSISFTRNGQIMVVAGYVPSLSLFHLESSKLLKTISLADYLHTIKRTEFVPQEFDGGNNKILVILSGQGILYFLNVEDDVVISELKIDMEISRFALSFDGNYLLCVLSSGEVEVFNIRQYITPPVEVQCHKTRKKFTINRKRCLEDVKFVKEEIENLLDIKKLNFILKEYGEYPETYRMKIWECLLELPNNLYKYNSVINHVTTITFDNLYQKYPLEDKIFLKGLKKLLNNLVTWCPFFANVEYLPLFAFPFVKMFHNKPLACFEAVCTIILNWCQHWFEYFPLAPINVLAIAENMLLEHDPELLHHFVTLKITTNLYIWALLETVFSEVLTSTEWVIMWDHILTNEISFLLCATVAYNMVQRHIILSLKTSRDFDSFYKNQNPIDIKRLLKVTYCLLKNTSQKFHPRQYFKKFTSIEKGKYPLFIEYPRKIMEFQKDEMKKLDGCMIGLLAEQKSLDDAKKNVIDNVITEDQQQEERRRLNEIQKFYSKQFNAKQHMLNMEQKRLLNMQRNFFQKYNKGPSLICDDIVKNSLHPRETGVTIKDQMKTRKVICSDSDHQKKLQMAMNIELVDKFIKTVETELKRGNERLTKDLKNKITIDLTEEGEQEDVSTLLKVIHMNKHFSMGLKYCKRHETEDCFCEVACPKTVRFSGSTTGGSLD